MSDVQSASAEQVSAAPVKSDFEQIADWAKAALPQAEIHATIAYGELTFVCARDYFAQVIGFLQNDTRCRFVNFIDLCGADYPARAERFDVVVHLLSPYTNHRIRVKCSCGEDQPVPSLVELFPAANWYEREAYDLYGILFSGHPELRRILTDYGFEGHPLRKDFPMTGFVEVRYDDEQKRVVREPVRLVQDFRSFDFLSPWEGTASVLPGDEKASS